jgi:hypothetical protein
MAKLKVSEVQRATTANYGDLLYLVQSGLSKAITVGNLFDGINGNVSVIGRLTTNTLVLHNYTYAQANALPVANGTIIYNSSIHKVQAYAGGIWVNLH